jgi:carbon starvation protein
MNSLLLAALMMVGYFVAYHTYGKFISRKIFKLTSDVVCPSTALRDDHDFVPTKKHILFGHHFTSIAGLGPIGGPAIAIIWGWVPAVIWIFFGSIFFGAIHDFGALVVSMRAQGRSIGDLASDVVNKRVRTLFLLIIFFELWIVIAIFGLVVAILFVMYPIAVIPVWFELVIAFWLGYMVYKKGKGEWGLSIVGVIVMYITVVIGAYVPIDFTVIFGLTAKQTLITWVIIVLALDAWLASSLPVQTLLQPRDFLNSHQLVIALALLTLGVIIAHPPIVAPAANFAVKGAPPVWPFLFVVIACGAISGFHSLVSSGTSSKQCYNEKDSLFIGYGSMLFEATLAALVICAVAAGIGMGYTDKAGQFYQGAAAFNHHYADWGSIGGLGNYLRAFIQGSANMIGALGIPAKITLSVMAVFVVSFAATTLDSATRIQRYIVVELATAWKIKPLTGRQVGTAVAVLSAAVLAFYDGSGRGALKLWPLFGSVNQLLAGLGLLVITIYLARKKVNIAYTVIPMIFMVIMTGWAMVINIGRYYTSANWLLFCIGLIVFLLEIWMIIESIIVLRAVYAKEMGLPEAVT